MGSVSLRGTSWQGSWACPPKLWLSLPSQSLQKLWQTSQEGPESCMPLTGHGYFHSSGHEKLYIGYGTFPRNLPEIFSFLFLIIGFLKCNLNTIGFLKCNLNTFIQFAQSLQFILLLT